MCNHMAERRAAAQVLSFVCFSGEKKSRGRRERTDVANARCIIFLIGPIAVFPSTSHTLLRPKVLRLSLQLCLPTLLLPVVCVQVLQAQFCRGLESAAPMAGQINGTNEQRLLQATVEREFCDSVAFFLSSERRARHEQMKSRLRVLLFTSSKTSDAPSH